MATHLLNTINITVNTGSWTAGDVIETFWNTSTETLFVNKNGSLITSGDPLVGTYVSIGGIIDSTQYGTYWNRVTTNYWYNNIGNDIIFYNVNWFPYKLSQESFTNTPGEETDNEVNDLSIVITSVTTATALTSDGVIVATASGANTPFLYSLSGFASDSGQSSGTFSSLPSGLYTITVKDSLGYTILASATITNSPATYATRWTHQSKSRTGITFRFRIQQRGYTGSNTNITVGQTPLVISTRGEGNDYHENIIIASQASMQLLSTTSGEFNDIAIGDEEEFKVIFDRYNGSTYDLRWQGYVGISTFSEVIATTPYMTNITAYDRLGDMKNLDFAMETNLSTFWKGSVLGNITELDALKIALEQTKQNQGYRIACNIFDVTQTTSNNTPINQTVFNSSVYTEFSGEGVLTIVKYTKCDEVIKDILGKYGAEIRSWEGYWNIRRKKELIENATVSYVEYNSSGAYVTTGSWTPRVEFKAANLTNRWRWQGGAQSWSNTKSYKNAIVRINTKVNEKGILKESSLRTDADLALSIGDKGYGYFSQGTSSAYLLYNDSITFDRNDSLKLKIKYNHKLLQKIVNFEHGNSPPYITSKWMLKVGAKYVDSGGQWTTTETFNEFFITTFNNEDSIEIPIPFDGVATSTLNYRLRVYIPSIYDYNVSGGTEYLMLLTLKSIPTITTTGGARRIARVDNGVSNYIYYFYELRSFVISILIPNLVAEEPNVVVPSDYHVSTNPQFWQLVTTREYARTISGPRSEHEFIEINLDQLPRGLEATDTLDLNNQLNFFNKIDYIQEINLFDEPDNINNAKNIYSNITSFTDGTTTGSWTELNGTVVKKIQEHLLSFIISILKIPRKKVNGSIYTDLEITPLNLLLDTGDSNRLFDMAGVSFNYFSNIHNGEIIEIGSDDTSTGRAHDSGHEIASHS